MVTGITMQFDYMIFGWGSPIGTGIFLLCLGVFIYLLSKADAMKKGK